jgi:hypothetical protein
MGDVPSAHDLSIEAAARRVFYCMPHNGEWVPEGIPSATTPSHEFPVIPQIQRSSFLNHSFNLYWCSALNQKPRPELWAMHHADMSTETGWLDELLKIMRERDADVVSCVAMIKDASGDTNAAVFKDGDVTRLSAARCKELPDVFSSEDVGGTLLVNTGLWVVNFTKPWVETFPGFSFNNTIKRRPDGTFHAGAMSEDWKFSLWANEQKLRVFATTRLQTVHYGSKGYAAGGWARG